MKKHFKSICLSRGKIFIPIFNICLKPVFITCFFGVIGFLAPLIYGYIVGFPIPQVQDEFSYVLAADTYAQGRLTNPTLSFVEHFETPHVLMEPSYMSKYPPMQGFFLAAGEMFFGEQIFGVWLSCGLFAATLFWMLTAWTKPKWAIFATILMILFLGINSYWTQSFWGGMVAASGGALFFGGFRRLFKRLSPGSTVLMTIGGFIMINSRPFEGALTMVLPLLVLVVWMFRDRSNQLSKKLSRLVLPGVIAAATFLSAMGYLNYRVTGNWSELPYSVHHAQYSPTQLFIFQPINHSANRGNERVRRVYEGYTYPSILNSFFAAGLPDTIYLRSVYCLLFLILAFPLFLFSPFLLILLYVFLPSLIRRDKWILLISATILFTFICMCFVVWWDQHHYTAPLACCFFLIAIESFRQIYNSAKKNQRYLISMILIFLSIGSFIFLQQFPNMQLGINSYKSDLDEKFISQHLMTDQPISINTANRATFLKYKLEKVIKELPDKYLVFVSYNPTYDIHDEIIYNKADLENADVIWANDLGTEKNSRLINFYKNRKIITIKLESFGIEINPVVVK